MGDYISLSESVFIALVSISVVFIVLVLISFLIYGLSFLKEKEEIKPKEKSVVSTKREESIEISEEIVATISAVLLYVIGGNKKDINISSIKKIS